MFSGVCSYSPSSLSHHDQSCSVSMEDNHQEMNGLISDVMDLVKDFSACLREEHLSEHERFFTFQRNSARQNQFPEIFTYLQYIDFDGDIKISNIFAMISYYLTIAFSSFLDLVSCI